jgi:hypothetical protein
VAQYIMAAHWAVQEGLEVIKRSRQGWEASARVPLIPLHQRHCPSLPWLARPHSAENWGARSEVSQRKVQKPARIHLGLIFGVIFCQVKIAYMPPYISSWKRTNVILYFIVKVRIMPLRKPLESTSPLCAADRSICVDMVLLWRPGITESVG